MASKRIQGITVEIGGDTSKLTAALRDVDKSLSTTQGNLRDVNKLLKLDPGNTELLAQKHRLLGEAVQETKERLETLKTAAQQANEQSGHGEGGQHRRNGFDREAGELIGHGNDQTSQNHAKRRQKRTAGHRFCGHVSGFFPGHDRRVCVFGHKKASNQILEEVVTIFYLKHTKSKDKLDFSLRRLRDQHRGTRFLRPVATSHPTGT